MQNSKSIVFFGSGDIGLATVKNLAKSIDVEALITKPDVFLRGKQLSPLIKTWAQSRSIPVYQPVDKAQLAELATKAGFKSPAGVVAEYGLIIPQSVIDYFRLGILNCHFSLLPRWRGADPIRAAILNGDKTSGVSLMVINQALDEGDIIAQADTDVSPQETADSLRAKLIKLSNQLLNQHLFSYLDNKLTPQPQDNNQQATYAPKITKASGQINWSDKAGTIERQIRAFVGWPGSFGKLGGKDVTILDAEILKTTVPIKQKPGAIIPDASHLLVQTGDGVLKVNKIHPAGKKPMTGGDFIRGYLRNRK